MLINNWIKTDRTNEHRAQVSATVTVGTSFTILSYPIMSSPLPCDDQDSFSDNGQQSRDNNDDDDVFYCQKCDLTYKTSCDDSLVPYGYEGYAQHRATTHILCKKCGRHYIPARLKDHEDKFHPHECTLCFKRFCTRHSLYRHKKSVHNAFPCILCNNIDTSTHEYDHYFDTKKDLLKHVSETHPDQRLYVCDYKWLGCPSTFTTSDELLKHKRTVHRKECITCPPSSYDLFGEPSSYPSFSTLSRLREHIATNHSDISCFYCGEIYKSKDELYIHQKKHCPTTYQCSSCDRHFDSVADCNAHEAEHVAHFGGCSTSRYPSQRQHTSTWLDMEHRTKPWQRDCTTLMGMGMLQHRLNDAYEHRRGAHVPSRHLERQLRDAAENDVRNEYENRIRDVYRSNVSEYVSRTRRDQYDGGIDKITVNLLENIPFLQQVETALRSIFDLSRVHVPFKMALAFGFLLYNSNTDSFETFYINDHLSRDATDRNIIHQVPNIWTIRNEQDEAQVFSDIESSDFFTQVRDIFSGQNYNFVIVRATHMSVQLFPMMDSNIYNDIDTNRDDTYGHALPTDDDDDDTSDDDDDDDDASMVIDDDDDDDDDDDSINYFDSARHPFIDYEADDSRGGNDELISTIYDGPSGIDFDDDATVMSSVIGDDDDRPTSAAQEHTTDAEKQAKLISDYLHALSRQQKKFATKTGTNQNVLVSLTYVNSITSTPTSSDRLSTLCFFYHLAFWHLQCKHPTIVYSRKEKGQEIKELGERYYNTYKHFYRISNDTNFKGVSLRLLPYLEYLFRTRINVFTVESLDESNPSSNDTTGDDGTHRQRRKRKARSLQEKYTPVLKCVYSCDKTIDVYKTPYKTLSLLLHNNRFYTIMDKTRLLCKQYKCFGCGKMFGKSSFWRVRHHVQNHCNKVKKSYKRGMVLKHENMIKEACDVFSIPHTILNPVHDADALFTSHYITFDFESLLKKIPLSKFPETVHKHHDIAVGTWIRRGIRGFIWVGGRDLRPTHPHNEAQICGPLGRGAWLPLDGATDDSDNWQGGYNWVGDGFPPNYAYELEEEDVGDIVARTIKNTPPPNPRNDDGYWLKVFVHNDPFEDFYYEWHGNGYPKTGNFPPDDNYSRGNMYTGECRNSLDIGQHDPEMFDEQVVYGDDSLVDDYIDEDNDDDDETVADDQHQSSTNHVSINVPLSFAMAANFDINSPITTNESERDDDDDDNNETTSNNYYTHYEVDESPIRLIHKFVDLLEQHAKKYKEIMLDKYYNMIEHIHQWFLEKGMEVNLLSTDGIDDTNSLCTLLDIPVPNANTGEMEYMKKDYNLIAYGNELHLVQRLKKFFNILPVFGFKSSGYDIPLIKNR